jgi:integrase/recombinase XerD
MESDKHATFSRIIADYLRSVEKARVRQSEARILMKLECFVSDENLSWQEIFAMETLYDFQRRAELSRQSLSTVVRLSQHVFKQGKIPQPLALATYQQVLPEIYEDYLAWVQAERHFPANRSKQARRVLAAFHLYLERAGTGLQGLRIDEVDGFLAAFPPRYAPTTCMVYRGALRGFLAYLYHQRGILRRDLASLIRGPCVYARSRPPKFLRPEEVQKLFACLNLSSPWHIRQSALVHLAYTLGLRPKEISTLTLDDVCFSRTQIALRERKNEKPIKLPLPELALKVMAAYLIGVRAKSTSRSFFLTLNAPYKPLMPPMVSYSIKRCMHEAGVPGTPYSLRHTYAQNLLEAGTSIFEIRDMLGHTRIETTKAYLSIDIKLMREVILDEIL